MSRWKKLLDSSRLQRHSHYNTTCWFNSKTMCSDRLPYAGCIYSSANVLTKQWLLITITMSVGTCQRLWNHWGMPARNLYINCGSLAIRNKYQTSVRYDQVLQHILPHARERKISVNRRRRALRKGRGNIRSQQNRDANFDWFNKRSSWEPNTLFNT